MKQSYFDSGGNDRELIAVLTAISQVSARMARNMTILANTRQWVIEGAKKVIELDYQIPFPDCG